MELLKLSFRKIGIFLYFTAVKLLKIIQTENKYNLTVI